MLDLERLHISRTVGVPKGLDGKEGYTPWGALDTTGRMPFLRQRKIGADFEGEK